MLWIGMLLVACSGKDEDDSGPSNTTTDPSSPQITVDQASATLMDTPVGDTSTLTLTLGNDGDADLLLDSVDLVDGIPELSLGSPSAVRIAPGETSTVEITFAPEAPGEATDVVRILSNDDALNVPVVGTGLGPWLAFSTDDLALSVAAGCATTGTVAVSNTGNEVLTISDLTLTSSSPELVLSIKGDAPTTLDAGASFEVLFDYVPLDEIKDVGAITIDSDDPRGEISSEHTADGSTPTTVTDSFVFYEDEAEMLFVVDDSGSMGDLQDDLGAEWSGLEAGLGDTDYTITVTAFSSTSAAGVAITPDTADPDSEFEDQITVGTGGTGLERGLDTAFEALVVPGFVNSLGVPGTGRLSVVFVSDEQDQSKTSPKAVFKALQGLVGTSELLRIHAIVPSKKGSCGSKYKPGAFEATAGLSGGSVFDLCDSSGFSTVLETIGAEAGAPEPDTTLSGSPNEATLEMDINGKAAGVTWSYDAKTNSIDFDAIDRPNAGDMVEVHYLDTSTCP